MTIMDGQSTAERALRNGSGGLDHAQLAAQYGWVHAVARNLVRDPWGAEDVTQETLLAALAAPPPDVPDDQRLRAWLGRVAFNLSRLGVRQGARRRAREVHVARAEAVPSVSDELESAATINELTRAIAALSEADRRAVLMRYFDGLSTAEIAERTGVSELAVRKRLWRARNKLRVALEPERRSGQFLALLLQGAWSSVARIARPQSGGLAGIAATLALCAGATWLWARSERSEPRELAPVAILPAKGRVELRGGTSLPGVDSELPPATRGEAPVRRTWVPKLPPVENKVENKIDEPRTAFAEGYALDLDGAPRPGLALYEAGAASAEVLATTDALGTFRIPARDLPLGVEARGADVATILPARFERAQAGRALLLVAPALDLAGRVVDEDGLALADVRIELVCDDTAFARVPEPVRLESAVLAAFASDGAGRFERPALPRAAGLALRIERAGFETLERPTLALGRDELFVLRATPELALVSGTVRRQDGRPAAGASVRLANATTGTDDRGHFRLPVRSVRPDSPLEASDKHTAPTRVTDFGSRVLSGGDVADVEITLGDEHDSVSGRLVGSNATGWLVAAFADLGPGASDDESERENPSAQTHSDAAGTFELSLARGKYTLYAVAPDAVRVVRRDGLDTQKGPWELELPAACGLASLHGTVANDAGVMLAQAKVDVTVLPDGVHGRRALRWGSVTADPSGAFAFPANPNSAFEFSTAHAGSASVGTTRTVFATASGTGNGDARVTLVAPRPAWLQLASDAVDAEACSVLDAEGKAIAARGPQRTGQHFALREGASAVLEVPAEARWLALERAGSETLRVPIQPKAGELLQVRP